MNKIMKIVISKTLMFFYLLIRFCIGLGGLIAFYSVFPIGKTLDIILNIGLLFYTLYPVFNWKKIFKTPQETNGGVKW